MRPRVLINMASSLDGKIAPPRKAAPFVMSRHAEDQKRMRNLRASADAVVIGASNLRADNPDLMPSPLRVVVTRRGEGVDANARMFDPALGGEAVVAHAATMPKEIRRNFDGRATLVELGETRVDMLRLLAWLGTERRCEIVLSEGGGALNAALFEARAVDALYLTLVPRILGGGTATIVTGDGFATDEIPDGTLVSCERVGDELFLQYEFSWA